MTRRRRRWLLTIAGALVLVLALPALLLLEPVQRRIVERFFPTGPGTTLEFEKLDIGLRRAELRDLRLDWHGLKVAIASAELRYRPGGLVFSGTARVDRLHVRGLVVDLRSVERDESAPDDRAQEPFVFSGLRTLARLPVRSAVADVRIEAEVLASVPRGTARVEALLTGRDIAPGATGELAAEIGLQVERDDATRKALDGTGSLRVRQTEDGAFDLFEFHGEVRPGDPARFPGAGLAATASTDLTAPDEAYRVTLSTTGSTARDVLGVTATRRAADGVLAATWEAHLDGEQTGPFLADYAPPQFALDGKGTFEIDPARRTVSTESRFEASASAWERLDRELASLGALRFDADVAADFAPPSLAVRSLRLGVAPPDARTVVEIAADQPFRVNVDERKVEPARWGEPLAHLELHGAPVTWWTGSDTGVTPLDGRLSGAVELTLDDARHLRLRSTSPVEAAAVRLRPETGSILGPFSVRAGIEAVVSPESFAAEVSSCRATFANGSRLSFDGSLALPRDGRKTAKLDGRVAAHPVRLVRIIPEVDIVSARGHFRFDLAAGTLSLLDAEVTVDDTNGARMVHGSVTTVKPLVVDIERMAPHWTEFEPDTLSLRVDGFPVSWAGRFVPQFGLESGTLHGELHAVVSPDRTVRIAGDAPLQVEGVDLHWGDVQVLENAHVEVSPSIVLTSEAVEISLDPIAYRDTPGNRFDGAIRARSAPTRGATASFTADLRAFLPSLTNRIGNLGDFRLLAEGRYDGTASELRLDRSSFDCKDPGGQSYLTGESLQPFTVGLAPFRISPSGASPDLFRATFIPLAIEHLFPEALGFRMSGPMPEGTAFLSAVDGGLLLHAPRELAFGPVTVTRNGEPFLDKVRFSILPEVSYTPSGVRSRQTRIEITSGGKSLVDITTRGVFDIVGEKPERSLETTMDTGLAALFDQPVMADLPRFDRGTLAVSWKVAFEASRTAEFRLGLTDVARRDGVTAPDLDARVRIEDDDEKGHFRIEAPIRLITSQGTSDLTAQGRVRRREGGNDVDLAVESERIVLEDVARLAAVFLPPGTDESRPEPSTPEETTGVGDARTLLARFAQQEGRPLWSTVHGRVPVRLRSVELDAYAWKDVQATLESTEERLAVEGIGASFLGARLGGRAAVTFEPATPPVYGVEATLEVADVDLGRMFTEVDPSRPPPLEGRFRLDAQIDGAGSDPIVALRESHATIAGVGHDAVFRGLVPGAKTASKLVRAAGTLTFSKALRATGRLIGNLEELHVHDASLSIHRDPSRGTQLDALDLRADTLVVRATGSVQRDRDKRLVDRNLRLDVDLRATGDAATVFRGLGLLGDNPDDRGFLPVTETFSVGGTVGAPDNTDLWKTLDDAAAHAKGSFGWALRKAMKMAAAETSALLRQPARPVQNDGRDGLRPRGRGVDEEPPTVACDVVGGEVRVSRIDGE